VGSERKRLIAVTRSENIGKALPGAVGSTRIGKRLGFGVPPSARGFVPIVTARLFDSIDPREVE
jgi:hypothetical protein